MSSIACGGADTPDGPPAMTTVMTVDNGMQRIPDASREAEADADVLAHDLPPPQGRLAWTGGGGADGFPVSSDAYQPARVPEAMPGSPGGGDIDATVALLELQADGSLGTHFATYFGGSGRDVGIAAALDAEGNVYVAGETTSADFPMLAPLQATLAGKRDAWVAKFSSTGALVFSTYLGGTGADTVIDLAVDDSGVYVLGATVSTDFPTSAGVVQPVFGGSTAGFADDGNGDGFVTKLALDGTLLWSTYLGGSEADTPSQLVLDGAGNPVIVGSTVSNDFPTTATAHQPSHAVADPTLPPFVLNDDAFVAKLAADGTSLLGATFFGGNRRDVATGVALTATDVYVSVSYESLDLPNASAPMAREKYLVVKLPADLSKATAQMVLESTADFPAQVAALAARSDGSLAMLVYAGSPLSLPGQPNVMPIAGHPFGMTEVAADLAAVSSVVFPTDLATGTLQAFAVDGLDRAHLLLTTQSPDFVTTGNAPGGGYDGYWGALAQDGSTVRSGSYFGGPGDDGARRCHWAF